MKRPDVNISNAAKHHNFLFEIIIIILIAINIIFMISFANRKFNEISDYGNEALFLTEGSDLELSEKLANEFSTFKPDSCKMIEIYSEDFELIFRVLFNHDSSVEHPILKDHQELLELLRNNEEGQTSIEIDDQVEDVYFRWDYATNGNRCLIIIYTTRHVVTDLWIFTMLGSIILILVFILLMRTLEMRYLYSIKLYQLIEKKCVDQLP